VRSVAGLIRRRGIVCEWAHAISPHGNFVDRDARTLRLSAGGARIPTGPTGEWYARPYTVRAYFSKKTTSVFAQMYGLLDERDAQLDLAVPFAPEPERGIVTPARHDLEAWNAGRFTQFPINTEPSADLSLVARDRFLINGTRYIVKSAAVPLQDQNATIAWRLLIGADTF